MTSPKTSSRAEWLKQRLELLEKEKQLTQLRDELAARRRELPWVSVDKSYQFGSNRQSLADLFQERSQLVIYHFMYGENWEGACTSCSFWADNFNGIDVHLAQRDISFLAVSTASQDKLDSFAQRMGWSFRWLSSQGSDFGRDFQVSFGVDEKEQGKIHYNYRDQSFFMEEMHGVSVFARDEQGQVYHTYSTYGRGLDMLNGAYNYIDLTPRGRNEDNGMSWLRYHDSYEL
ncbi:MAG: DUF899 domain-containing protein [Granulosicoccaceae bacterium]